MQERSNPLVKAVRGIVTRLSGPDLTIEPRKGARPIGSPRFRSEQWSNGELTRERPTRLPAAAYRNLAENDDIIWSIRQTIRRAIGEMEWKIVPDTKLIKSDLKRWRQVVELNIAMPGLGMDFVPQAMPLEFFAKASGALRMILQDEHDAGEELENNSRIRAFFKNCEAHFTTIAEGHIAAAQRIFERPSPRDMSDFRGILDRLIDDITLWDAAGLVKVPLMSGEGLGEIYTIPGEEIRLYRCKDRSQPQPPYIAYDWAHNDQVQAVYNNLELTYMMMNPQGDGYGKAPLDVLVQQIMATLAGDGYILDFFMNNNTPRGVFDLGPNVDEGERAAVEERWNQKVAQGLRRIIFVSNHENVKGWVPIPADSNDDTKILELQKQWANRKCAAFGLSLQDIGFTEDLHRTTADTQQDLTQSRGVNSVARRIASYFDSEVIRGYVWARENPDDPTDLRGKAVPILPFRDVRFEFNLGDTDSAEKEDERDIALLRNGVISINEKREKEQLPPVAGGDVHVVWDAGTGAMRVESIPEIPGPEQQQAQQQAQQLGDGSQPPQPGQQQLPPGQQQRALPPGQEKPGAPSSPPPGDGMEKRLTDLAHDLRKILDR